MAGSGVTLRVASSFVVLLVAACGDLGGAREELPLAELRARVFADSAAGDSAALAALPPRLRQAMGIERHLTDSAIAASPGDSCRILPARTPAAALSERRQVHLRLPDSSAVVMFVRADADGAGLERVEVVRNPVDGQQLGWVWDARDDDTIEARWPRGPRGFIESAPQPRGGPIPRAVRALGRRVLALSACTVAEGETAHTDE